MTSSDSIRLRFVNLTHEKLDNAIFSIVQNLDYGEVTQYFSVSPINFGIENPKSTHYTGIITTVDGSVNFVTVSDHLSNIQRPGTALLRILDENNLEYNQHNTIEQLGQTSIDYGGKVKIDVFLRADTAVTILVPLNENPIFLIDSDHSHQFYQPDFVPENYVGTWYQIADLPQYFEGNCHSSRAHYTLLQDRIKVTNTCFDESGNEIRRVIGRADVADKRYPAGLIVSFDQTQAIPGVPVMPKPEFPNYIIHATDYFNYTLIGSSDRSNLYILGRQAIMDIALYRQLVERAAFLGYDVNKLMISKMGAAVTTD